MHVLVIEDNPDLAANVCDFLEAKGHSADAAGDGITGLHLAVTQDYDAIVLDVLLPGMDGFTLCKRLREEARRDTPVLMLTALDSLDDRVTGLAFGANDYVVKPFALRELETRLKTLSRRAHGATGLRFPARPHPIAARRRGCARRTGPARTPCARHRLPPRGSGCASNLACASAAASVIATPSASRPLAAVFP